MPNAYERYIATEASYAPDKYYRYAELTQLLLDWRERHPNLLEVESIGRSYEGRDLWGVTMTNAATGPANEKPAYHIDANIHAGEITGSAVVLYTINWLLANYGTERRATWVLDNLALYLVPRICVDGSELYMTTPTMLRSSVRPYPGEGADERDGLRRTDLNGDGFISTMRVKDPTGPWKVSDKDARVMVPRAPDEVEGEFYRLYPEGELVGPGDGGITLLHTPFGLDLNRNFPVDWQRDTVNPGAGPYPFSEPETRALADWLLTHPNVSGSQHYHTHSAIIIRPSSFRPDEELPMADWKTYEAFDAIGLEETGYPADAIWDHFNPQEYKKIGGIKGTDLDWIYEHLGIYAYTTELWNINIEAGVQITDYIGALVRRTEEDELAALRWADEHIPGEGFLAWQPFDHPQLGPVEIGGWNVKFTHQNPPGTFLEPMCRGNMFFTLRCAMCAPRVKLGSVSSETAGEGVYRVRAVVENLGFLPTWVSEQARAIKKAQPVAVELAGEGIEPVTGRLKQEVGDLRGRADQFHLPSPQPWYSNEARKAVEFVVTARPGTTLDVTSRSHSGGVDRKTIVLD